MATILPDQLEPAAVVPQCLDNQYVSDPVLDEMLARSWNFNSERTRERRRRDVHREFVRSIIYSQQVVVNRAYLVNNPFFHQFYDGSSPATEAAFAELVRDGAIVPFQGAEPSLVPATFDVHSAGARALQRLLEQVGDDFLIVRLARNPEGNASALEVLAQRFFAPLMGYTALKKERAAAMLRELSRRAEVSDDEVKEFQKALRELSTFVHLRAAELADADQDFNRNEVYKQFFVQQGASVADGDFGFGSRPFARELKKLVDLRYNTVLPDALNRFAFAPFGFPARSALQDVLPPDDSVNLTTYLESLDRIARSDILQRQHADMLLPDLDELTLEDVVRVRGLAEWRAFAEAQSRLLAVPIEAVSHLPDFREKLLAFQDALHRLYDERVRSVVRRRCVSVVGIALKLAGLFIPIGHHSAWSTALPKLPDLIWDRLPPTIKGISVELIVNVSDLNGNYRNMSHSYQMESIRSQSEFRRDEIKAIVAELQRSKETLVENVDPLGEQSRA